MKRFLRSLPLPVKLLIIAFVPILFTAFLTFQLYREKSKNVEQIKRYLDHINQSATITRLIDQLQKERRFSFDYTLAKTHQMEMITERPITDSFLTTLALHHDSALNGFMDYAFLENIDSVRNKIDEGRYGPDNVMHYYSNTIFRLSTLNTVPVFTNRFVKSVLSDLSSQKLLSEMITYLGLINANVYNVLYTRKYMIETLMGTVGTYDVYTSYEKQLLATSDSTIIQKYQALRYHSALKPVSDYLARLFTTFHFDSSYNYSAWNDLSDQALNLQRNLQMNLLQQAERNIHSYYQHEKKDRSRVILALIACIFLFTLVTIVILFVINSSLNELRRAALKIAKGETDIKLSPQAKDSVGSLASSIRSLREKNEELANAAVRIGQGDFTVALQPRSRQDVLGNALAHMKENLSRFTSDLKRSEEEFKSLADLIPQIVWTAGPDGHADYYNKKWYQITGTREGSSEQSWVPLLHPLDVGPTLTLWHHSIQTGEVFECKLRFREVASGSYRWFLSRALPIKDEEGKIRKWFGTATDIHNQIVRNEQLEEEVTQRTSELKRSNEDLQQFAHVASHDLKEPLRKIRTFSDRLVSEFGDYIPQKGKIYLNKVQVSSERMTDMIESILNYSMINASEQIWEIVDLNSILEGIENDLELVILQREARIVYQQLPQVKGAPALLYQLFYNLINNALKFSRPDVHPVIKVSSAPLSSTQRIHFPELLPSKEYVQITIEDNGIGFNQQYADKVFQVFTRLNSREQYEGTGLGLALCKRIIHRHHGIIYAKGVEGAGATFTILLPEN